MDYSVIGEIRVSSLGVGTEYLNKVGKRQAQEALAFALDNGANYFDLLFAGKAYMQKMAAVLAKRRKEAVLALSLYCKLDVAEATI